jgi:type I restriction enzyme, R subunit
VHRLQHEPLEVMAKWVKANSGIGRILDWRPESGKSIPLPISEHPDKVISVTADYGETTKPEDFLTSFAQFVQSNINKVAALQAVVQRPRELTRADLKALRVELDRQGFSEARIRSGEERGHCGFYCRLHSSGGPRRPSRSLAGSCACCDDTYN